LLPDVFVLVNQLEVRVRGPALNIIAGKIAAGCLLPARQDVLPPPCTAAWTGMATGPGQDHDEGKQKARHETSVRVFLYCTTGGEKKGQRGGCKRGEDGYNPLG
jgi:hypothetical protein